MNMGYIYLLTDKRNNKKYVGKHNGGKKDYITSGIIPTNIIKKYGNDIFDRIILEDGIEDDKTLSLKEVFYIKKYNTIVDGYNLTNGGEGGSSWMDNKTSEELRIISEIKREKNLGRKFSDETLRKMSLAKKGIPLSESHKKKIKDSQSGENHPWFGKKHSEETKNKMSELRKGKKHSEETKNKMSELRKGKKSPRFSEYSTLNNRKNKGVPIEIEGVEYDSIIGASEILKITTAVIKYRIKSDNYPMWDKIIKK